MNGREELLGTDHMSKHQVRLVPILSCLFSNLLFYSSHVCIISSASHL